MHKAQVKSSLILLLAATIWGVSFVAQSAGMDHVGPFTFNAVRSTIGAISLLPVIWLMDWRKKRKGTYQKPQSQKALLVGGILCGVILSVGSNLQQVGIMHTTVGKAGFITACYIVFIPIFGLFIKRAPSPMLWGAVALSVLGLYLLCMSGQLSINIGDIYVLACSVMFALHLLVIDHYSPQVDGVKLSCIQFFICGGVSAVLMLLFEQPNTTMILKAWLPILYAGVMACSVAFTLQIIGQKNMNPTPASLILSLEYCMAAIAGWLLLGQKMSLREIIGCLIMFAAIVLAQLPASQKKTVPAQEALPELDAELEPDA